jgi:acetoin utilization deacetylase AcuC-like enzyme
MEGEFDRVLQLVAFGGHHAMRRHGEITFGFCYLNQEAIVLRSLQARGYIRKALILDCDCHHGNGIQDIFYDDPTVLYISLHQDPRTLYPGVMGFIEEIGEGAGRGYNVNLPLPPHTTCASYLQALSEIFPPLAREFQPDLLLFIINADTHFRDPLTSMGLDLACYPQIARLAARVAEEVCGGRMLVELGGGYDVQVAVNSACWITACLAGYEGYQVEDPYGSPGAELPSVTTRVHQVLQEAKRLLSAQWRCFG